MAWVPWDAGCARTKANMQERRRDMAFSQRICIPSVYLLKGKWYFATQPVEEPEHLADMAKLLTLFNGEDHVMFASD